MSMTEKTRGIVLHQIRYSDSGIVVWIYSRKFGRQSLMIKGVRNKKSGNQTALFQPMSVLDLVIYYKESRGMQTVKEFYPAYSPSDIFFNIKKTSVAIFLGEVLATVLREETPNEELYDFLESSVIYFDRCAGDYANFHIAFLSGLGSFLGFEPGRRTDRSFKYFDLANGSFTPFPPLHGNYADEQISGILAAFFATSYENTNRIALTGAVRNEVLDTLMKYYSIHLPGLKKIRSLEVLKQVFS